jgi:uncharacterized membrane protein (UPF0127 family)
MTKKISLAGAALLCCLAAAYALTVPPGAREVVLTLPDGAAVTAELALTPEEQARGLMFREKLAPGRGMLFVFSSPDVKTFWMKNTLIDLDMVFLDGALKVLKVFHRVPRSYAGQPESEVARAAAPATLVLELPAGAARAHRVRPGAALTAVFPPAKKNGGV